MLFELLCIAGVGLLGYKAVKEPEATKETVQKIGDIVSSGIQHNMKVDEMKYRNGTMSEGEYLRRQDASQQFLSKQAEIRSHHSHDDYDEY